MGREIKRVALDFDWPMDVVWRGFVNPFSSQAQKCWVCDGTGASSEAKHLTNLWYGNAPFRPEDRGSTPFLPTDELIVAFATRNAKGAPEYYGSSPHVIQREARRLCDLFNARWSHHLNQDDVNALVKGERLWDFTRTWTQENGWQPKNPPVIPTAREVNDWSIRGFGHDSISQWIVVRAECERLGYTTTCTRCNGEGSIWPSKAIEQAHEDWQQIEPPAGEGYQVWETVSEGSPITPVFATKEALVDYLVGGGDGWDRKRGDGGWTRENATAFVDREWAPSLVGVSGELKAPRDGM